MVRSRTTRERCSAILDHIPGTLDITSDPPGAMNPLVILVHSLKLLVLALLAQTGMSVCSHVQVVCLTVAY